MKALHFPFSIDIHGGIATATTYAEVVRGQLIDVLMTNFDERVMRSNYGSNLAAALFDPTEELVQVDAAQQVAQRIGTWTPRVTLLQVRFDRDPLQPGKLFVTVSYKAGPLDEARQLRVPVSEFLSEETPV
jgi:phage baseplate assembly protein W